MGAWVNNSHVTSMFTGIEQLKTQKVKVRLLTTGLRVYAKARGRSDHNP